MAPTFALLKDINKNRADWRIKVCCARKWMVPNFGRTPRTLEMVFVDKENNRIQATVKGHLIDKFEPLIKEHEIHCIKQFTVGDNKSAYPATNHQFRIFLFDKSYVGHTSDPFFPQNIYNFRTFPEIKNTVHSENSALFDVLGHVVGYDSTRMQSSMNRKCARNLEVLLEDHEKNRLSCTLWEEYADIMKDHIESSKDMPLILLLQLCRTKTFKGETGISNTFHATKLLVNAGIKEMDDFKDRLFGGQDQCSQQISKISTSSCFTVQEELENKICDIKTLRQIYETDKVESVWVVAIITEVIAEKNWSYTSCKKCLKKVVEHGSKFFCESCHCYNTVDTRFKVHVNVVDGTQCLTLLLWDRECRDLIGKTAKEIRERLATESLQKGCSSNSKSNDICKMNTPIEIECLVGKQLLFKVNVKEKNIKEGDMVYSVMRVSNDSDLIGRFKSTDHIITISDDDTNQMLTKNDDQDSVNDNEVNSPIKTTFKRSQDEAGIGLNINESDRGSTEQSSTKLRAFIKTEDDDE